MLLASNYDYPASLKADYLRICLLFHGTDTWRGLTDQEIRPLFPACKILSGRPDQHVSQQLVLVSPATCEVRVASVRALGEMAKRGDRFVFSVP